MSTLAATVIAAITPLLVVGGEEFAKSTGKAAFEGLQSIVTRLSSWWSTKAIAKAAVESMPESPAEGANVLATLLDAELARNPQMQAELESLLAGVRPHLEVISRIEVADGVTGAKIAEFLDGTARLTYVIGTAKNFVGVDIGKMGGN
jgi:hypothetical protein